MTRWADLDPDPAMAGALDATDALGTYEEARIASRDGRAMRHGWSNRFSDQCALMIANEIRATPAYRGNEILPRADGTGYEAQMFIAHGRRKRIDVVVATLATGLRVGWSLKGLNTRDPGHNFDHNLTGRTYELLDEVGAIHEHQPTAFMVALYFMPVGATADKQTGPTSFARTVAHLRAIAGRDDPYAPNQIRRLDAAFIGLYAPGTPEDGPITRGVARYFDVRDAPPARGRPRVETTMTLADMVNLVARVAISDPRQIDYAQPEEDPEP